MPLVASVTDEAKIPVICGENGMVAGGGLATLGIDYYKLGEQTGKMAAKILNGEDPATMPIEYSDIQDICTYPTIYSVCRHYICCDCHRSTP